MNPGRVAGEDAEGLRLYQNDVPVRNAEDFSATPDPKVWTVRAPLAAGLNRFVAMAARRVPGSVHGRSPVVAVEGPNLTDLPQGRVHTLALGINEYKRNPLEYADQDAQEFAAFLKSRRGADAREAGVNLVLRDRDVTNEAVEEALRTIRKASRPEDTVVVFLAGHTDVRRERFRLLLTDFAFDPKAVQPGLRGAVAGQAGNNQDVLGTYLPYVTIYRALARMNALNRMVVIDACQAEAIFDDPGVRLIQQKVDDAAHEVRTAYLLAARKGEAAGEASVLKHGLLTYLLLRGLGSRDLVPEPGGPLGNADLNEDGLISSDELRQYVEAKLPVLSARVDLNGRRANLGPRGAARPPTGPVKVQGTPASFPLIRLP